MKVDQALISKLEDLTRLRLSSTERIELGTELSAMLDMVEKLNELDIADVDPLEYVYFDGGRARADQASDAMRTEDALRPAPDAEYPYFRVPQVIKSKKK